MDARTDIETAELLHALGFLYTHHGQTRRGLVLLLLAAHVAPNDVRVLRTLAHALIVNGDGKRALAALERLAALEPNHSPVLQLLRSRALWESGDRIEARRCFRAYIEERDEP
jgi:type III secretion protein Y